MLSRKPKFRAHNSLFPLALFVAFASAQMSVIQHEQHSDGDGTRGVVVERLKENGSAYRAGMRAGDILLRWSRDNRKGEIESPFNLNYIGFEEASRGPLRIEGIRGSQEKMWILHSPPWGISARPNVSGSLLRQYHEAEQLMRTGKVSEAIDTWRAAADAAQIGSPSWLPLWFLSHGGESLFRAKQMRVSDDLYREAVERAANSDGISRGDILRQWATELQTRENLSDAENYYQQELFEWRQLDAHVLTAQSLNALGVLSLNKGNLSKAESYFIQSSAISEKHAPSAYQRAESYVDLAVVYQEEGNLGKAEKYYRLALPIEKRHLARSAALAETLTDLGVLALWRGNLKAAETYHREALSIATELNEAAITADVLDNISDCRLERGDLAGAEKYQKRALRLRERNDSSLLVASSLGSLGKIARLRKEYDQAEQYFRRGLDIVSKVGFESPDRATFLAGLGDVAGDRGNLIEAERLYRTALAITDQLMPLSIDHAKTLASIGAILRLQGRLDEAADFYRQCLSNLENQTASVGALEETQARYRATQVRFYREYVGLLLEKGEPELAFQVLEGSRARALVDMLAHAQVNVRQGVDAALLAREEELRQSLNAKSQRLIRLLSESQADQRTRDLDLEISNLREDYQRVQAEIRERSPGYAALVQPRPLSMKDVQQLLDADTVLLEYSIGEERSHVWAITNESFAVRELPKRAAIEHEARNLYLTLASRSSGFADPKVRLANWAKTDALAQRLAADLSRRLLGPVADLVKGHRRLVIVSDGVLQYVPFAALSSPDAASLPLIVRHEIVSLPSASIIAELRHRRKSRPVPTREVAILADPVFENDDVRVGLASIEHHSGISQVRGSALRCSESLRRSALDVGLLRNGKFRFNRLVYTRDEAAAIAAAAGRRQVMQALDFRANRATAMSPELANYRIVHFATHGLVNSKNPALSGLVLSLVDSRGRSVEGFFGLEDVYNTKLPVDMVVLSGCQTALGEDISGEGLIGLTRGFMYAGATRVVASLWSVSDEATAALMAEFYKAMERDGMRPAAALQVAQTKMLKHQRWRSPYYWAAFQIQGEWQ